MNPNFQEPGTDKIAPPALTESASDDKHRVTVGAESVAFLEGYLVGVHHLAVTAEGGCRHEHRAVRQMEICDEGVGN